MNTDEYLLHAASHTPVDLTNCEREPIHIPGSIQPHGVLLVLKEPELLNHYWFGMVVLPSSAEEAL
jgi:hypothetical protein